MKDLSVIKDFCPAAYDFIINEAKEATIGKYELGNGIYANIQEYTTKARRETKYESHKKYIDVQFILQGKELIAVAPIEKMKICEEYNEEKDVMFFFPNDECKDFVLESGDFLILYPNDVHMPCVCVNEESYVRKVVVKIPVI